MPKTREANVVTWTFETNDAGDQWALFVRANGESTQLSRWYASEAAVRTAWQEAVGRWFDEGTTDPPAS